MAYEDTVLIKLRRDYEKDEVVMYVLNQLQEKKVEIGKLKSYIQELEDNPVNLKNLELISSLQKQNSNLQIELRRSKGNPELDSVKNKELRNKIIVLTSKLGNMKGKLMELLTNPKSFNDKTLEEKTKWLNTFTDE